ncbi:MAG: bacillithiol system redox-active protein YtxJ [Flavobacterium sp.]|nr:bacillithiol system redox-active protein YtxJ [Flavobacterium sp.]
MSIFKNIFGSVEDEKQLDSNSFWIALKDLGQINEIITISEEKPVVIFKHSTRCSVSRMALKQFENEFNLQDKMDAYFLDLIENRDISNEIAKKFDVVHQSPQLLLIKNGKCIYNISHSDIDAGFLKQFLD